MTLLITLLSFLVAIGVLVAVHEFGHYWVARRLGIKVLRFSIGFGRPLWRRVAGPDRVEYVLSAIPLGGYVKLLDEREGPVPTEELSRAFNRQPHWKRIAVLVAGAGFNFLFAIAAYWILLLAGIPSLKAVVGDVTPDSPAAHAGLRSDDRIVEVAQAPVVTREDALIAILENVIDDGRVRMQVIGAHGDQRNIDIDVHEQRSALTQPEALLPGLGFDFWFPRVPAVAAVVAADGPAAKAGVLPNDEFVAIDGRPVQDFASLVQLIRARPDADVQAEIRRPNATQSGATRTVGIHVVGDTVEGKRVGRIGIERPGSVTFPEDMRALQKYGPVAALSHAAGKTWDTATFTLRILGNIVAGHVSVKNISGPISIAEYTGFAARQGFLAFLNTLALISISLGVLNLLPVPILDGGQVLYQLVELIKGSPVSERAQLRGQQVGIVLLLLLMSLAFYNDIARHLS